MLKCVGKFAILVRFISYGSDLGLQKLHFPRNYSAMLILTHSTFTDAHEHIKQKPLSISKDIFTI